jgi:hypothetical protein
MKSRNQRSSIRSKRSVPTMRDARTSPMDPNSSPIDLYSNNIKTPSIQGSGNDVDRPPSSHSVTDEHLVQLTNRVATPPSSVIEPKRVISKL